MFISISLELKNISIIFSLSRLKFGIHWKDNHIKLLNFSIGINPSKMSLLILGLKFMNKYTLSTIIFPLALSGLTLLVYLSIMNLPALI